MKLFLKGERCFTDKCAYERRAFPPGAHGQGRQSKPSDYGIQLREKQKVKRIYGVLERQFRNYFEKADRMKGITGENLLVLLERRLDNVLFRMGVASSRNQARQLVRHCHLTVNGRKVSIPSFLVKPGDIVKVAAKSAELPLVKEALEGVERRGLPAWLSLEDGGLKATFLRLPTREEIALPVKEQLIVELYSK
jgi:small subunit ribosomal protein S4